MIDRTELKDMINDTVNICEGRSFSFKEDEVNRIVGIILEMINDDDN
tara:strand:+ start:585 stop:725 length:141 start_codon:yes stop_codon:yes gene_type:complete